MIPFLLGEFLPAPFNKLFPQLDSWMMDVFETYTDEYGGQWPTGFSILCGLRTKHSTLFKPIDKEIIATYKRNSWAPHELLEHMYPECPFVFATGRGLYSITLSDELMTSHFYDTTFNLPYFYSPDLKKFVFPIDQLPSLLRKVTTNLHAKGRFDALNISKVNVGSDPKTIVADVYQTNFALYQMSYALMNWERLAKELEVMKQAPEIQVVQASTVDEAVSILEMKKRRVAMDVETSGFDFMRDRIGDLTLAYDHYTGYHIPWEMVEKHDRVREALHQCFKRKNIIGANFKFDMKFIRRAMRNDNRDWTPRVVKVDDDVIQAGHVLNEGRLNSLKTQTWIYTPYGGYNRALDDWKEKHPHVDNYLDIPDEIRIPYAAADSAITFYIMKEQEKQFNTICAAVDAQDIEEGRMLPNRSLYSYYKEIMMPVVNMLADIEYKGICVQPEVMNEKNVYMKQILEQLEKEIREELQADYNGQLPDFDITSPTQLGRILEEIGWPCIQRNASKVFATHDNALKKWNYAGYTTAKKIQKYRSWAVGLKTFIGDEATEAGWWTHVREEDDGTFRMHPEFMAMRADSGRHRCRNPNLQNIPSHGDLSKVVKAPLSPPSEDYYIASVDFDSFQLKIAAVQSKDPVLYEAYSNPEGAPDIHSVTAHKIFGERLFELEEVDLEDDQGKVHTIFADQYIVVERDGKSESMKARDFLETQKEGDVVVLN